MTQPEFNWTAQTSGTARASRRSGRQRVVATIRERMRAYRQLLVLYGPMTDMEAAERLNKPLSVVCAVRGDWRDYAAYHGIADPVEAVGRVKVEWGHGAATSRAVWQWVGER